MCLISITSIPSISKEVIECYKVLLYKDGNYYAPYTDFLYNIGETYTDKIHEDIRYCFCNYLIDSGFFHACKTLEVAEELLKCIRTGHHRKYDKYPELRIFKAEIPKDTQYYIGANNDICAKSIKIIEEV